MKGQRVQRRDGSAVTCQCNCQHDKRAIIVCWQCECACDPKPPKVHSCACCGFTHPAITA